MKMLCKIVVFLIFPVAVYCALDSRGKEFIITFMDNKVSKNTDIYPEIFVTTASKKTVHVNVTSPRSPHPRVNLQFVVTRGVVHRVPVNKNLRLHGTEMSMKGILIEADEEIDVYGVNREVHSNDAYLALPTDALGRQYYTISYSPSYKYCEFAVIGINDHTHVSIKLANHPYISVTFNNKTYHRNQWINVTMNRFSTFEITSVGDLTGSFIISDKHIGVLSGNMKAVVGNIGRTRDHLVEMLLPVRTWGNNFATVPIPDRTHGDIFRFIASRASTTVTVTGVINNTTFKDTFTIPQAGGYVQKNYSSSLYSHIVSNQAISVYQFSVSQTTHSDIADPSLITVPPIEQYAADYAFTTPKYSLGEYLNYFMFIIDSSQKDGLLLNNQPLPAGQKYVAIPGTNLVAGYVNISVGTHTVSHNKPATVIGGIVYGKAQAESYGFPIGLLLETVNTAFKGCHSTPMTMGDYIDNDCDGQIDEETCGDEEDNDEDGRVDEDCRVSPLSIIG